jgi:glutathione S-transferase
MSKLTLIIGNKNYSSWSLRPWILMKHFRLDFKEKRVALFTETADEELSEYHSDYKVPILKDNEFVVWDSLSILEYISEQYLEDRGWPSNAQARSVARSISAEMHSSYLNIRNELPMNCRKVFNAIKLSNEAAREVDRISWIWRKCRNEYGNTGEWLFGEFTIADAMFAPIALRFHGYSIPLSGVEESYVKSVLNHPGIIDWIEAGKLESEIIEEAEIEA